MKQNREPIDRLLAAAARAPRSEEAAIAPAWFATRVFARVNAEPAPVWEPFAGLVRWAAALACLTMAVTLLHSWQNEPSVEDISMATGDVVQMAMNQ